ncbi:hypothetical protein GCM10020001_110090 [Nonomuraea salmonea]
MKVNDSHLGPVPVLPVDGGTGRTGGPDGEANLPMLRTTHLQAISTATDVPDDLLFDYSSAVADGPPVG